MGFPSVGLSANYIGLGANFRPLPPEDRGPLFLEETRRLLVRETSICLSLLFIRAEAVLGRFSEILMMQPANMPTFGYMSLFG